MPLDLNEVIEEGEFAGLTVGQLIQHTASVNKALAENRTPPPPPRTPPSPAERLQNDSSERVDSGLFFTWARLEQDDEQGFSATVPDYEEYRAGIAAMKDKMHPQQRIAKGLHARLYEYQKLEKHPELRARVYEAIVPVERPEDEEEETQTPAPPPPKPPLSPPSPPPTPPPAPPRTPAPAPPTAPPARLSRPAPPAKPGLRANAKLTAMAASAGMSADDYIAELSERGLTQDDLDRLTVPRAATPHRSIAYGRVRASR